MRQGQQNRRGRGRNNNNRKSHNPLSRSFESNGPDVKIRGTPAHIAEKYLTLARDAQSSGDPVLAENYLQHAEHYIRIIMAYREQLQQPRRHGQRQRPAHARPGGRRSATSSATTMADEACSTTASQPPMPPQCSPSRQPRISTAGLRGGNRDDGNRHDRPFRRDQGRGSASDRDQVIAIATATEIAIATARPGEGRPRRRSASRSARRSRPEAVAAASSAGATASRSSRTSSPNSCAVRCAARAARTASRPRPPRKSRAIDARRAVRHAPPVPSAGLRGCACRLAPLGPTQAGLRSAAGRRDLAARHDLGVDAEVLVAPGALQVGRDRHVARARWPDRRWSPRSAACARTRRAWPGRSRSPCRASRTRPRAATPSR